MQNDSFEMSDYPEQNSVPSMGEDDRRVAKKRFSRLGLSATAMLALTSVAQLVLVVVLDRAIPGWKEWPYSMWLMGFCVLYAVGIPVGLLAARRVPVLSPEKGPMTVGRYLCIILICIFMMEAGNLVGLLIQTLMENVVGTMPTNPIETFATDDSLILRILFMVILAPLIEEFVFRRFLIDRMRPYGEKLAVVTSALMFGLFHGNLSQMFYAFTLGLVFGYVYLRTGKLRWSVGLHMLINFFGGVVSVELLKAAGPGMEALEQMDAATLMQSGVPDLSGVLTPGLIAFVTYSVVLLGCAVAGLVILCVKSRKVYFEKMSLELPRGRRISTAWLNAGMLLFLAICLASVVLTYV